MFIFISCQDNQVEVIVKASTIGSYPSEVSWEIKQFDSTVAIGKGEDAAKSICLEKGQVTVTGRDTNSDSWNGYQLTIVGINGTVFLPPWSGPANEIAEATTMLFISCQDNQVEVIVKASTIGSFPSEVSWEIKQFDSTVAIGKGEDAAKKAFV